MYRLFSWEHSYFSGKVRAYLRWKQHHGALGPGFEDVLATPDLLMGLLLPKSGTTSSSPSSKLSLVTGKSSVISLVTRCS